MCPIETPEGPNIGLIGSLSSFAVVSEFGFVTTRDRVVKGGKVTDEIVHVDATEEQERLIAQETSRSKTKLANETILCRTEVGHYEYDAEDVYLIVSPQQIWSVATAMIPFLEHDDANRAMGSNMQRQAVPLLKTDAPLIGTGMERRAAIDTGDVIIAEHDGTIDFDATRIVVATADGRDEYELQKFMRSSQDLMTRSRACSRAPPSRPATCWPTARRRTRARWPWART